MLIGTIRRFLEKERTSPRDDVADDRPRNSTSLTPLHGFYGPPQTKQDDPSPTSCTWAKKRKDEPPLTLRLTEQINE